MNALLKHSIIRFDRLLPSHGYVRVEEDTYKKQLQSTFGLVGLVEYTDNVIPRLSVGLPVFDRDKVVLSTDLHVLVSPAKLVWYSPGHDPDAEAARIEQDFIRLGLPWLERHTQLDELTRVFEARLTTEPTAPPPKRWWQRSQPQPSAQRRPVPMTWRVLSYCYQEQGRWREALEAWRNYVGTAPSSEDQARSAMLEAKIQSVTG